MTTHSFLSSASPFATLARLRIAALGLLVAFIAGCGGSADAPPPFESGGGPVPVAPTITQQPADAAIQPGATATFTVTATGTAPLSYQWQKNGVAVVGATAASYTTPAAAMSDDGSTYRAVVSNSAGSATSTSATLSIVTAPPVLTVTPQPQDVTVLPGANAGFTVGGTCSSGTVQFQWQRLDGGNWADIAGATAATYAFVATSGDNGAQFRATLSCGGQSATASSVATLTVGATSAVTLSALPVPGLDDPAFVNPRSIVRLSNGDYVFDSGSRLKRLSADLLSVTVYSGAAPQSGAPLDGPATVATYGSVMSLAVGAGDVIYVADTSNEIVRRVAADGSVTTIAGVAGQSGSTDGTGSAARFNTVDNITLGPDGNLYVTDNQKVRSISPAGVVSSYAGSGALGRVDGPAATATFTSMNGLAAAANGDLYVMDNGYVRRVARSGAVAGNVLTIAGNGAQTAGVDGTGAAASLYQAHGPLVVGSTLYLLDYNRMRAIDLTTFAVTTVSGNTATTDAVLIDGPAASALYRGDWGAIVANPSGGFIVVDAGTLRRVDASGAVSTIAANYVSTSREGSAVLRNTAFEFATNDAQTLTADGQRGVYIASEIGREVRHIDATGHVDTVAGLPSGTSGNLDGTGSGAQFDHPGNAIARASDGTLFVSDSFGIRRIGTDGAVTMYAGSRTQFGDVDGDRSTGRFNSWPTSIAVSSTGDLFVVDSTSKIKRVDAAGVISTYAGTTQAAVVDGPIATARFRQPSSLALAPDGTLYVVDGSSLRKITSDGNVTTVAGAPALSGGMVVDSNGTVYGFAASGLYSVTPAGVSTLLVPRGSDLVLGSVSPTTGSAINGIGLYGAKQLVYFTILGEGVVVTLP